MTNNNNNYRKTGFLRRLNQFWGPAVLLASCFYGGFWVKSEIDAGKIALMESKIKSFQEDNAEILHIEDFFAKFDVAQMSPIGEYQILVGDGTVSGRHSPITGAIDSALISIQSGEWVRALAHLKKVEKTMPSYPFTYFYMGIAELSNVPRRAISHFKNAHEKFSFLLRIRPNNSSMRLCDAMSLSFLGLGDSATIQLYRAHKYDPDWRQLGCEKIPLQYDSTALSLEERRSWQNFVTVLSSLKCDTVKLSRSSSSIAVTSPPPEIQWPPGYGQIDY